MYYGLNVIWVEAKCIYYTSPLPFMLVATPVGLLFDLVVVIALPNFGRVKPLDYLSS
jgi:hypothetical protein